MIRISFRHVKWTGFPFAVYWAVLRLRQNDTFLIVSFHICTFKYRKTNWVESDMSTLHWQLHTPSQTETTCWTDAAGPGGNSDPCVFPFVHDGKEHHACTWDGAFDKNWRPWCGTNYNSTKWGDCDQGCPKDGTLSISCCVDVGQSGALQCNKTKALKSQQLIERDLADWQLSSIAFSRWNLTTSRSIITTGLYYIPELFWIGWPLLMAIIIAFHVGLYLHDLIRKKLAKKLTGREQSIYLEMSRLRASVFVGMHVVL